MSGFPGEFITCLTLYELLNIGYLIHKQVVILTIHYNIKQINLFSAQKLQCKLA